MTFNAEWLFLSNVSGPQVMIQCPGHACSWKTEIDALRHLEKVARMIQIEKPDIVHIVEVGGYDVVLALISLIGPIPERGEYRGHFLRGNDSITGQNCCLLTFHPPLNPMFQEHNDRLTKYPIPNSQCLPPPNGNKQTLASKHYGIEFIFGSTNILLVGLHLLAHPNDRKQCSKREGQAQGMRDFALRNLKEGQKLIIIGDMNDYDNDVFSPSPLTISLTLQILKGGCPTTGIGPILVNAANRIKDPALRYSTMGKGKSKNLIDHILIDPSLVIGDVKIYNSPTDFYRWGCGTTFENRLSDHFPIKVRIDNL